MCGLTCVFSKKNGAVGQQVYRLYKKQETRGKEGFGFLTMDADWNLTGVFRYKYDFEFREALFKCKAPIILGHHRMPTSTKNTLGTTHPFFVSHPELKYDYYWAHNGGISNKDSLKKEHNTQGYEYKSEFIEHSYAIYNDGVTESLSAGATHFNDSECLAVEMSKYAEDLTKEVGIKGAAAFWGIALEKGTKKVVSFYYGKNNGRDLCTASNKKYWSLTSITGNEVEALKLFSRDKGDPQLYEQPLEMDEYITKRPAMGFQKPEDKPEVKELPPSRESLYSGMIAYQSLENKHYTFNEAIDTGVPLSEFFAIEEKLGNNDIIRLYIPNKFNGQVDNRQDKKELQDLTNQLGFPGQEEESMSQVLGEKEMNLLESLCTKYVKIELDREDLEEFYINQKMPEHEYEKQDRKMEKQMQEYEEKIWTSGASDELIEELIDTVRQLESYSRSYHIEPEMEYIQTS